MLTRHVSTPCANVRWGLGVAEITPPIGICHRMFGAATHDRATGIHRPLQADVIAVASLEQTKPALIRVELDHCGFVSSQHEEVIRRVSCQARGNFAVEASRYAVAGNAILPEKPQHLLAAEGCHRMSQQRNIQFSQLAR